MSAGTVTEVGADGIAIVTICNPPLNLLNVDVTLSLGRSIKEAVERDDVKAIVITGSNGKFSGGFNVTTFGGKQQRKGEKLGFLSLDIITDTLEASSKPIVAAIDGPAFGGGLEVAMACHARISTSMGNLGLTELQYGIIPGFGGTQRLPRLVGLEKALDMLMMSKRVNGNDALILGLVDAIAPPEELVKTACGWALDIVECRKPWYISLYRSDRLVSLGEARRILKFARVMAEKHNPNIKHPVVCIDVIEEGIVSGPRFGLWKEAESLKELKESETCKSLVHFFFAQRAASKIPGVTDMGLVPRKVKTIAIVGGGIMDSEIATVLILSNYHVILKELNESCLQASIGRIKAILQSHFKKENMAHSKLQKSLSLLQGILNYESFKDVDLVIEAASDNVYEKKQIFVDLKKYCPRHCIFASSTTMIDLNLIGEGTNFQNQIAGIHFLSPVLVMPIMEIVRTRKTSPQVIVDLLELGKKIKKNPIVVGNCTGFAVNRMCFPYTLAALLLVDHGADVYQIDQAIMKFGMPTGPFRKSDQVGFDVAVATNNQFEESFPERLYKSRLITVMQEAGRGGESSLRGFYTYDEDRKAHTDPEITQYIEKSRKVSSIPINPKLMMISEEDLVKMILFPVINEACRLLAEGIAVKASDLDIASVMGMGFPSYRGGIIFWGNTFGSGFIYSKLEEWSKTYGEFFKPCAYLAELAYTGASLGSPVEQAKSRL